MLRHKLVIGTFLFSLGITFCFTEKIQTQTVLIPAESHIWPLDEPTQESQTCSQEHGISGVVGEFRTSGGNHFHAGVDMPATNTTDIFSVASQYEYVYEVTTHRVGICAWFYAEGQSWGEWRDGNDDTWFSYRYKHVDPSIHTDPQDDIHVQDYIVWNSTLTKRTYNPSTGWWEYPQHLPICEVEDYGQPGSPDDHLHFEEVCYDDHDEQATDGYFIYNPLNSPNPLLCPFEDENGPVIEENSLYDQVSDTLITNGSGTKDDPYCLNVNLVNLDIWIHAYDSVDAHTNPASTRNVGVWAVAYDLYDESGNEVGGGTYYHSYIFWLLGPLSSDMGTQVVTSGVGWIYDTNVSSNSDYYYWATNNYSATSGGSDGFMDISQLPFNIKYEIRVGVFDVNSEKVKNSDIKGIWIKKVYSGINDVASNIELPNDFSLLQNSPNPFNSKTVIRYQLPRNGTAKISIFNLLGQKVRTLMDERKPMGYYTVCWDGKDDNGRTMASGIYFYKMKAGEFTDIKKMVLLK